MSNCFGDSVHNIAANPIPGRELESSKHRRARARRSLARNWLRAAKAGWLTHFGKRRTSRALRLLRRRENRVPDTRKILFQNVTSFGHKARTCLLSDQMDYDIMGVAEHHLDLASAAEEAGRLRVEGYRSIWTPANFTGRGGTSGGTMAMIKPHWKFSRYLEGYGDLAEPLKRSDWTPIFWHLKDLTLAVVFAYFSTGDDAQAANQVKMAQVLEFTHSIRTPFVTAADFNMEPDQYRSVQGSG